MKKIFGFLGAGLLAIVGSGLLIAYVKSAEDRVLEGEALVEVLVASGEIGKGTASEDIAGRVSVQRVPAKVLVNGAIPAVAELTELEGLVTDINLLPGEQLSTDRFVDPEAANVFARNYPAPPGMLEVTLSLDPERVVGGSAGPGDHVAIVASFEPFDIGGVALPENYEPGLTREQSREFEQIFLIDEKLLSGDEVGNTTHILAHKVLVTHLQTEEQPDELFEVPGDDELRTRLGPEGNVLVTVAVDASTLERLIFAQEFGMIWLAAEPLDAPEEQTDLVTRANVFDEALTAEAGVE